MRNESAPTHFFSNIQMKRLQKFCVIHFRYFVILTSYLLKLLKYILSLSRWNKISNQKEISQSHNYFDFSSRFNKYMYYVY